MGKLSLNQCKDSV